MIRNFKIISILALVAGLAVYCGENKSDEAASSDEPAGETQEATSDSDSGEETKADASGQSDAKADTTVAEKSDVAEETTAKEVVEEPVEEKTDDKVAMSNAKAQKVLGACTSCHYLDKGSKNVKNGMGPGLKGVYNRKPTNPAIQLKAWTTTNLHKWLNNPKDVYKKSRMSYRITDKTKRSVVIEALKVL
ncbi:MAG: hypothetical protein ABUK01_18265 [Leptospirales bacterium]